MASPAFTLLDTSSNEAVISNLTINTTYSFAISAQNIHGLGLKSTSGNILVAFAPL